MLYGMYQGVSATCGSLLYESWQAQLSRARQGWLKCRCQGDESVDFWTSYGRGFFWKGRACRSCKVVTHGFDPHGDKKLPGKGIPIKDTLEYGSPDWVDDFIQQHPDPFAGL